MIDKALENLYNSINNSTEYQEYLKIANVIKNNKKINKLIDEIKELQKKAVKLEYEKDDKYQDIDKEIEDKVKKLNNISEYQEYKDKLKKINNILKASSSLIEDYINDKTEI